VAATSRGSFVQGHLPAFDANNNVTDSAFRPRTFLITSITLRQSGQRIEFSVTIQAGTLLVIAGGVGGNTTGQNYAVFTGVSFPNDDQTVSATWV